jgi:thiol-disulfide isomerase/thioredoxin
MTKTYFVLAVSALLVAGAAIASPFEVRPLAEVLQQAGREGKLAFVDFYANWCDPCKQVDATVFPDPKVQAWLEQHTVPVAIDGERGQGQELRERFQLKFYPTFLLLKPDGTELGRYVGSLSAEAFLETFDQLRTGTDRVAVLEKAVADNPKDWDRRLELAGLYEERDKAALAREQYLALLDGDTMWAGVAAGQLLGQDETDEALAKSIDARADALLQAAIEGKATPGQTSALIGLLGARKRAAHLVRLEAALREKDLEPRLRYALARRAAAAELEQKRYEAAAAVLRHATGALEPGLSSGSATTQERYEARQHVLFLYGALFKALLLAEKPQEARAVAERSLGLDVDVNNYNRLAWAAFEAEKSSEFTLELARRGHELAHGQDLNMADTLANVLHQLGRKDEALDVIDAAVKTTNAPKRLKEFQELRGSITNPKKAESKES